MKTIKAKDIKGNFNIAIVVARFNEEVTKKLHDGAIERLRELEFIEDQITVVWVPGAVEIPLVAKQFASEGLSDAVVCLGGVIRGETSHYDYVCEQVSQGCQRVMLDYNVPVIFGILTTEDTEQALERVGGAHGHKGRDAVDAAYEMVSVLQQVSLS